MKDMKIDKVLFSEAEIRECVRRLAGQIESDYAEGTELLCVGVLKGCFVFMADIIRALSRDVTVNFMEVSSYGDSTVGGELKILKDLTVDIKGRDVLIIEDIIDSGRTISKLREELLSREPASLKLCAMFDKPARREVECDADYIGLEVPDVFVVGYGLDYAEQYRNLPYLAEIKAEDREE